MKPLLFQDELMTLHLVTGWEDYDCDKNHRTLELKLIGKEGDPKEIWKVIEIFYTEYGVTIKLERKQRKENKKQ